MTRDPLELFHEWVQGDEMVIATATADGRPSARALLLKSADERGFTFFTGYTSRKGRELDANPRAALLFRREGIQVRVEGRVERIPPEESDAYWQTRPAGSRRSAAASQPVGADRLPRGARGRRRGAARRSRSVPSAGAATGSCRTRTSSGATGTTGCTNVTCSGHARTAGSVYFCNREEAAGRRSRAALARRDGRRADAAEDRRLPGVPGDQCVEPARRQAAGRGELGDDHLLDRRLGGVHADFGSGLWDGSRIGIPYTVVHGKTTPKSRLRFEYADESDKGPYPIPANVPIEGQPSTSNDGDRHALIVDRDSCKLYELYALQRTGSGWTAGSGAIFDLRSNKVRPGGLDVGGRGRPPDPPRARAVGR